MTRTVLTKSMAKSLLATVAIIAAALHVGACSRPAAATTFLQFTTDTTYTETDPTPSPDGQWLAFTTERGGSRQVWIRPIGGGNARQLSHEPDSSRAMTPTWTPDGKSLLFISTRTKQYNVYRVPFEGGEAVSLSNAEGSNRFATYSPDGSKIVFTSNRLRPGELWGFNIYMMDAAGEKAGEREAKQITDHQGSPGHPVWAPDGKWVAFVAKAVDTTKTVEVGPGMTAKQNAMFSVYRLFKVPAEGGELTQLTGVNATAKEQSEEVWPNWSPDGKWIAVQGRAGPTSGSTRWRRARSFRSRPSGTARSRPGPTTARPSGSRATPASGRRSGRRRNSRSRRLRQQRHPLPRHPRPRRSRPRNR